MNNLDYVVAYEQEAFGKNALGIQILVASSVPVDLKAKKIVHALYEAAETVCSEITAEIISKDPDAIMNSRMQRVSLLALFPGKIFVEEIPNGYCRQSCCRHLPWFVVTTEIGRFKIGWRKRVIHLEWTETLVKATADDLFPAEDVTKHDRVIHAWGYDKARSYIQTIVAAFNTSVLGDTNHAEGQT
jgi:hypothetical protein